MSRFRIVGAGMMLGKIFAAVAALMALMGIFYLALKREPSPVPTDREVPVIHADAPKRVPAIATPPSPTPLPSPIPSPEEQADTARRASLQAVSADVLPLVDRFGEHLALYRRARAERRDEAWAAKSEAQLRQFYSQAPGHRTLSGPITINCGTTLCEVFGRHENVAANRDARDDMVDFSNSISNMAAIESLAGQGYRMMGTSSSNRDGQDTVFVLYLQRAAPFSYATQGHFR